VLVGVLLGLGLLHGISGCPGDARSATRVSAGTAAPIPAPVFETSSTATLAPADDCSAHSIAVRLEAAVSQEHLPADGAETRPRPAPLAAMGASADPSSAGSAPPRLFTVHCISRT
jgi:hypothetical protein